MDAGYLALDDPANAGDDPAFVHVDWGKTQAYALGLNAIYLNLAGRESAAPVCRERYSSTSVSINGERAISLDSRCALSD